MSITQGTPDSAKNKYTVPVFLRLTRPFSAFVPLLPATVVRCNSPPGAITRPGAQAVQQTGRIPEIVVRSIYPGIRPAPIATGITYLRNVALFFVLSLAVTSCSNRSSEYNAAEVSEVSYTCDQGASIQVRFFPDEGTAVLVRNGKSVKLQPEPAGSGFHYSNGHTRIRGKGNNLRVLVGKMAPVNCSAP